MEDLHAVGGDGFQHRDAGGQRGKNCGDEEQQPHNGTCFSHGRKDFWQRDKHQARPGAHAFGAGENVDGGDNHGTRQQGYAGIKNFDLVDRFVQVHIILDVGAVGNHNAHRDAQREKELAHGIEQNLQKAADGQPLKMRGQVVQKALHAGAGLTVRAGVMQRQRVACNDNGQYQQNRHHVTGDTLDAALDTVVDDERRHTHEQQCEYNRRDRRGDKRGKVAVGGSGLGLAGQVDHRILSDPTANDSIVGHNQHRHQKGQNAEEFPLR